MTKARQKIGFLIIVICSLISGLVSLGFTSEDSPSVNNLKLSDSDSWAKIVENDVRWSNLELYNNSLYLFGYYGHVSKYDTSGSLLWEYASNIYTHSYVFDSNGNILLLSDSSLSELSLIKLNTSGRIVFSKTVLLERYTYDYSINLGANNSMIITSYCYSNNELHVIKLNSSGNQLWNKSLSVSDYMILPFSVSDSNNNFYIPYYNDTLHVAKINGSGELLWQIELGDPMYGQSLTIDTNDILYLIGTDYDKTSIFKINSSGSILKELVINDFVSDFGKIWYYDDILMLPRYDLSPVLYCYDENLTYKWNFSLPEYIIPYFALIVDVVQDSQGDIHILQTTHGGDLSILQINSSGTLISQIIWGGSNYERQRNMIIDSENNLYFLCYCSYFDNWRVRQEYIVLVKNPLDGGVPPKPDTNLRVLDYFLFSVVGIACIISLGALLSILKTHNKIIKE